MDKGKNTVVHSRPTQDREDKGCCSLLPFKVGFFSIYGTLNIVTSFLPLYLKQLGLKAGQIGTVMAMFPIGGFLGGAMAPFISEKWFGEHSATLTLASLYIVFGLVFILVSPMPLSGQCPNASEHKLEHSTQRGDLSWLFDDQPVYLMVSCSGILFCLTLCGIGFDTILHGSLMKRLGRENSHLYGTVRGWGSLGHAASSIVAGVLVATTVFTQRICSVRFRSADYHIIFYVFAAFASILLINNANTFKDSEQNATLGKEKLLSGSEFRKAFTTARNIAWLFVMFSCDIFVGVTQCFLNWHIENLGGSPSFISLANCVVTLTQFAMFSFAPRLIAKFGREWIVVAGIVSYCSRFVLLSFIANPVLIIPMEFAEGVTFACIYSAIVSHISDQVPEEGQTQAQGMTESLCMVAKGMGYSISGGLAQAFGASNMFFMFAGLALVALLLFVTAHVFPIRTTKCSWKTRCCC